MIKMVIPQKWKIFFLSMIIILILMDIVNSSDSLYFNANCIIIWILIFCLTFINVFMYNFLINITGILSLLKEFISTVFGYADLLVQIYLYIILSHTLDFEKLNALYIFFASFILSLMIAFSFIRIPPGFYSKAYIFFYNNKLKFLLGVIISGLINDQIVKLVLDNLYYINHSLSDTAEKLYEFLFLPTHCFDFQILNYIVDIFKNSLFSGSMAIVAIIILKALCKILELDCYPKDIIAEIKEIIKSSIIYNIFLSIHKFLMEKSIIYKSLILLLKSLPCKIIIILQAPLIPILIETDLSPYEEIVILIIYNILGIAFLYIINKNLLSYKKNIYKEIEKNTWEVIGFLVLVFITYGIMFFDSPEDPSTSFRKASLISVYFLCFLLLIVFILNLILKTIDESNKKISPKINFNLKLKIFYNKYIKNFIDILKSLLGRNGGEYMETYKMNLDFEIETEHIKNRVLFVADSSRNMLRFSDKDRRFSEKVMKEIASNVLGLGTTKKDNKIDLICCGGNGLIESSERNGFVKDPEHLISAYLKAVKLDEKMSSDSMNYTDAITLAFEQCFESYKSEPDATYSIVLISNFSHAPIKGKTIRDYFDLNKVKEKLNEKEELKCIIYVVAYSDAPKDIKDEISKLENVKRWCDTEDGTVKNIRSEFQDLIKDRFEVKLNLPKEFSFIKASIDPEQGRSEIVWDSHSLKDKLPVEVELSHTGAISSLPYLSFEYKYNIKLKKHNLSLNKEDIGYN